MGWGNEIWVYPTLFWFLQNMRDLEYDSGWTAEPSKKMPEIRGLGIFWEAPLKP